MSPGEYEMRGFGPIFSKRDASGAYRSWWYSPVGPVTWKCSASVGPLLMSLLINVLLSDSLLSLSLKNFEVEADDLVAISELGRGAYGVVEKVRHTQSGTIMAVKVRRTAWR